jgi:hypothetical protein
MIGIEVIGGIKKDRELADEIVWFCMDVLLPRNRTTQISVELTKTFEEGAWGFAHQGDDDRDFFIQIDHRLSRRKGIDCFIETVCHEMIHVWQLSTKQMKDTIRGGYKQLWKCKDGKYRNYSKAPYHKHPWETQAYAMEGHLAELFKKEHFS